ncbi:outer membrane protein assembly factor BamB family protein [Amycolatopsis silviterrae]|uniref:PQQ-binding-like beta-propeller repeat protein n=1 Tax=Amycolatopsis silviterrae TaxID=1656914 RepID=A0ABW5H719_9PSEU
MNKTGFRTAIASTAAVLIIGSTASPAAAGRPGQLAASDWPTYHRDNARTGDAVDLAPLGTLGTAWKSTLDGAVYGQPLVVGGQILAATENNTVYALDPATGAPRWSAHLGEPARRSELPCGNIDPLGITGTMVYDAATSRVYALAELTGGHHVLAGVNVTTGAVEVRTALEPPKGDPIAHQQRSALTLHDGRVYVPYGGLAGDCANYIGSVASVTTASTDPISYSVPTTREAGIWAPGGGVVDGQRLLFAVGNGESTTGYDDSDSVLALSPALQRVDLFAPDTWADDNAKDLDLGSSNPTLLGEHVIAVGKRGTGYVLRHDQLGGIGGELAQTEICRSFGGSSTSGDTAYLPCSDGPAAVRVDADGTPHVIWRAAVRANGSPTIGGGAVWVVDYRTGVLYALAPADGSVRAQLNLGTVPHFASPTLSGDRAYVGTMTGVVAVSGA